MPTKAVDLTAYLIPARVLVLSDRPAKPDLLDRLAGLLDGSGVITDSIFFRRAIHDRERVTSTAIGGGIAIPHARLSCIRDFALAMAVIPQGMDADARDRLPVQVTVMIAAPDDERSRYLQVLAAVAARLGQPSRRDAIVAAGEPRAVCAAFLA